ncbi:MAG: signal recognition particle receptor subunit alpha, partial [Candidatus Krumholzibacteria bacterium]|nr:signal recognition particle receptor subunit alpha [Candidatus Krumholzibacteria bacterium]
MRRIFDGLRRTRERLLRPLQALVSRGGLDADAIEELESILYGADLGVEATEQVIEGLRGRSFAGPGEALREVGGRLRGIIDAV